MGQAGHRCPESALAVDRSIEIQHDASTPDMHMTCNAGDVVPALQFNVFPGIREFVSA